MNFKKIIKDNFFLFEPVKELKVKFVFFTFFSALSSILDGISILVVFPILSLINQKDLNSESFIHEKTSQFFNYIGLNPSLENLILTILFLMIIKILIQFAINIYINFVQFEIMASLKKKLLSANFGANWLYFTSKSSGKLIKIINQDTIQAARAFTLACNIFSISFQISVYLFSALFISFYLTTFVSFVGFLMFVLLYFIFDKTKQLSKSITKKLNDFSQKFIEICQSMKPLIVMGCVKKLEVKLKNNVNEQKTLLLNVQILKKVLEAFQEFFLVLTVLLLLFYVVKFENIEFEKIAVLVLLFSRGMAHISKLQKVFAVVSIINYPYHLVKQTLKNAVSKSEINTGKKKIINLTKISLENIDFGYSKKKIINGISMQILKGDFIGFFGKSGIGKTTLVDLITGIISPSSGSIKINNIDFVEIDKQHWRSKIGYVPQDTILFNDTLYNNIVLENKNITKSRVIETLNLVGLSDFVKENNNILDQNLGEGGRKVSGGIKQRISLARAIIRQPILLILDEVTSSLDDETERKIIKTIEKLKKKMTIIAISHKPAIIEKSSTSFKLNKGKLIK